MAVYICQRCGKEFDLMGKSKYCWDCRHRTTRCVICGKDILQTNPEHDVLTCSRKCWGEWRKKSGQGKQVAAKSTTTKIQKYGNAGYANRKPVKCKLCGKEFIPNGPKHVYCPGPHFGPCPVCGKQVEIRDPSFGPTACSEECRTKSIVDTARRNNSYEKGLAKNRQTCLEKYGVAYYSQTPEWKEKVTSTNNMKFGTDWAMQDDEYRTKVEETNLKKYGVKNPAVLPEFVEKAKNTLEERYGGIGWASPELNARIQQTCLEKYGDKIPARTLHCKQKAQQTCLERYGEINYPSTKQGLCNLMRDKTKIDEFWEFKQDPVKYVKEHYDKVPYVDDLAKDLGISENTIYDMCIRYNCRDLIDRSRTSIIEREVYEFLCSIVPTEDILWCNHTAIYPLELDFYLPKYNFAIECNPTFTHNSSLPSFSETEPVSTVYHRNKTNKCEEKGIFLFHLFGYDWANKQEIVKSMIRSSLNKPLRRIYARTTTIKEVDYNTCMNFLNVNHRQGSASSSIRLGLFTEDDELVAVMTFGHLRNTIGKNNQASDSSYELIRFCSLLNTAVVGGASKLFKWFINSQYNPQLIMSFSDRAHTKGSLYPLLGFKEVKRSDPGYAWVNIQTEEYKNRVSCQKHNLPNVFDDITEEDMNTKSEKDIMIEHGYAQVYDSGTIRWEWTPENNSQKSLYEI